MMSMVNPVSLAVLCHEFTALRHKTWRSRKT